MEMILLGILKSVFLFQRPGPGRWNRIGYKKTRFRLKIRDRSAAPAVPLQLPEKSGHSAASAMMDRECAALDNGRPPVPLTQPWAFSEQLGDDLSSGLHCRLAPPGGSLKC